MSQIVVLNRVRHEGLETEIYTDVFVVDPNSGSKDLWVVTPQSFEQRLRGIANEFLSTDKGLDALEASCQDFNWGDLIQDTPDKFFYDHGIWPVSSFPDMKVGVIRGAFTVEVDQDEYLFSDEHVEALMAKKEKEAGAKTSVKP